MRHSSRVLTKYFSNAIEQAILTVIVQEIVSDLLPCPHPKYLQGNQIWGGYYVM